MNPAPSRAAEIIAAYGASAARWPEGERAAVLAALEAEGLDVRWARVSTLGSSVLDAFCLETAEHEGLDPERRLKVEEVVLAAAASGLEPT